MDLPSLLQIFGVKMAYDIVCATCSRSCAILDQGFDSICHWLNKYTAEEQ